MNTLKSLLLCVTGGVLAGQALADDRALVAALDTEYQAAVERNDADAMARILHPEFRLVLGDGRRFSREDLLQSART